MQRDERPGTIDKSSLPGMLLPAVLAVILVSILFQLPRPSIPLNQPYRVELLLALFVLGLLLAAFRRRNQPRRQIPVPVQTISLAIEIFVLWSAISVLWGAYFGWTVHHTLLWSLYLVIFLLFTGRLPAGLNFRFSITTFAVIAFILGVLCLVDYLSITDFEIAEFTFRARYAKFAELLVTVSPLLWAAALYARGRARFVLWGAAATSWIVIMLSLSKGAFVSGAIAFAIFFAGAALLSGTRFRKQIIKQAVAWLVLTIAVQIAFSLFTAIPSTTNYLAGSADHNRASSGVRVFTWKVARQMAEDNWLTGVGADNFGLAFNRTRVHYRELHPDDPDREVAENYLLERAHNEPLQVLTELGVIGLVIFILPFVLLAGYVMRSFFRQRYTLSPILWASLAGMAGFLVSSQFSSFSFRAAQNGAVFFMVMAIAMTKLGKTLRRNGTARGPGAFPRYIFIFSLLCTVLLTVLGLTKVYAEYHVYQAELTVEADAARAHYVSALATDPEYSGAHLSYAGRTETDGDYASAARSTRNAIDTGIGTTMIYSQLAKQLVRAHDYQGADDAYREAILIYPRSIYIRTEYAVFLETQGNADESAKQLAATREIDLRQANGWYAIMKKGSVAAFYESQANPDISPPADLVPGEALRPYVDKIPGFN